MATLSVSNVALEGFQVNRPPVTFDPKRDCLRGFWSFWLLSSPLCSVAAVVDRGTQAGPRRVS